METAASWESGREEDGFRAAKAAAWFPWALRLPATLDWLLGKQMEGFVWAP